jgi:hypothetical protein
MVLGLVLEVVDGFPEASVTISQTFRQLAARAPSACTRMFHFEKTCAAKRRWRTAQMSPTGFISKKAAWPNNHMGKQLLI